MTARYWVAVSQDLLDAGPDWESIGVRLTGFGGWLADGNARRVLIEDPGAPPELDGQDVQLSLSRSADGARITGRRMA